MVISLRAEAFRLARAEMNLATYSFFPAFCVTRFTYENAPLRNDYDNKHFNFGKDLSELMAYFVLEFPSQWGCHVYSMCLRVVCSGLNRNAAVSHEDYN